MVVHATNKMSSTLDGWIYWQFVTHALLITIKYKQYTAIVALHNLLTTVAHALGFLWPH
jgi:hypothetical protein